MDNFSEFNAYKKYKLIQKKETEVEVFSFEVLWCRNQKPFCWYHLSDVWPPKPLSISCRAETRHAAGRRCQGSLPALPTISSTHLLSVQEHPEVGSGFYTAATWFCVFSTASVIRTFFNMLHTHNSISTQLPPDLPFGMHLYGISQERIQWT